MVRGVTHDDETSDVLIDAATLGEELLLLRRVEQRRLALDVLLL